MTLALTGVVLTGPDATATACTRAPQRGSIVAKVTTGLRHLLA